MLPRYQYFSCAPTVYRGTRAYRVAGSECNECSRRPIHLAQARRSRHSPLCIPEPSLSPRGKPTETADTFDEDKSSFGCGGRLTVELCLSRPANSRAEPSRPLTFLPLSLFLSLFLPFSSSALSRIRFTRDRDAQQRDQRRECRLDSSLLPHYRRETTVREPEISKDETSRRSVLRWILNREASTI